MTYAIVILAFLALPAAAAAARIAAYYRYGAHGRPDLESGHTRVLWPAEALSRARHPSRLAAAGHSGTKTRRATLRPVFNVGATPVPERISPWPSDEHIRREFDLDSPEHRGRAA
ncbi:MAG: hypothetical protein OXH67_17495 [Acidimicrobiaceae bacterium]|nr:hypothetical protein [Acidimicrobiaceae bacterium]MDE0667387.1 hypothetical protein [Acidimicrobiaceae bacterium]MYE65244.1 hypothetical protein [Acidimicrobiaceae bacterium]